MATIEDKIKQFKSEVGNKTLSKEQAKIYNAFTKVNGKKVAISVVDCEGVVLKVTLIPSKEVKKILLKHYRTSDGTVTANQILRMFDVVRTGSKRKSQGNVVYSKVFRKNGVEYRTVVKIFPNGKDAVLKSFHSTIGYK